LAPGTPEPVAPRGANGGAPSWVIQVASVATTEAAAELVSKLRAGGFAAFEEKAEVNGKVYYRVRVGPELDRTRAEQTAARLRERHKVNTLITNYP
jgi:DedD protein